jgi:hypothetical protein
MSRKARVFSDSKSFIDGISPGTIQLVENRRIQRFSTIHALDDLAEDTRRCHVEFYCCRVGGGGGGEMVGDALCGWRQAPSCPLRGPGEV